MSKTYIEASDYVAQYFKDRYGLIITGKEVEKKYPRHEIVWEKFIAYAYYKINNCYECWEDVPEPVEGMCAYIVKPNIMERRMFRNGEWRNLGSDHPECYK